MAINSRDKRASILGLALPPLLVLPEPSGSVDGADRTQLAFGYRLIDVTGVRIYLRQATDVAGIIDAIVPQWARTRSSLDSVELPDQHIITRYRHGLIFDQVELSDSVIRVITLPSVTIIVRQVTDTIHLTDVPIIQRYFDRITTDSVIVFDVADWVRFREQAASDTVGLLDTLAFWRERIWSDIDLLEIEDQRQIDRQFTRQRTDYTSVFDRILHFYYPVVMNYEPIRGIRIGGTSVHKSRLRVNFLGLVADAGIITTGHSRGGFYPAKTHGNLTSEAGAKLILGVQVGMQRIAKSRQRPIDKEI